MKVRIRNLENVLNMGLTAKIEELQKILNLSSDYKFLFLMNGTLISKMQDIRQDESLIIISKSILIKSLKLIGRQKSFKSGEIILQNSLARNFYYQKRTSVVRFQRAKSVSKASRPRNSNKNVENNVPDGLEGFGTEEHDTE